LSEPFASFITEGDAQEDVMSTEDRVMAMCATALEMEERGRRFYEDAASRCRNPAGRDMFRILKEQEVVHIRRIKRIYEAVQTGEGFPEVSDPAEFASASEALEALFKGLAARHEAPAGSPDPSDLEAVETGIDLEQSAIAFYEGRRPQALDPKELTFIDLMIREEKGHHRTLNDMRFYLTDPAGWFREREHGGLDGA